MVQGRSRIEKWMHCLTASQGSAGQVARWSRHEGGVEHGAWGVYFLPHKLSHLSK